MLAHVCHELAEFIFVHRFLLKIILFHEVQDHLFVLESRLALRLNWIIEQTHHIGQ